MEGRETYRNGRGQEIRWFYQAIEPELCKILTDDAGKGPNLFQQLNFVLSNRIESVHPRKHDVEPSDREQVEKGLLRYVVGSPDLAGQRRQFFYREIGPDWLRFKAAIEELGRLRDGFLQTCLEQGRVLVVDQFNQGMGPIPPTRWQREPFKVGKHVNYHFILSKDFPRQWINDSKGPRDKAARQGMAEAIDWLEAEYANLGPDRKPKAKAQYVREMRSRFDLSENAADEAWKRAAIPGWKRGGRLPRQTNKA